jgi:2,4-dienoyl-CoA reductase-like NADH-dependent reductase (Old Yellow Enzyme family)
MATIYDPIRIGPLEAPNRFHHRPMWSGSADPWGFILPRTVEMYRRIARGVTASSPCRSPSPQSSTWHRITSHLRDAIYPGVSSPARFGWREPGGIQLTPGPLSNPRWQIHVPKSERFVPAPSDAPADWSYHGKPTRALTPEGVEEAIESFAQGAARAAEAEFDYVMIHATHGSLPMQFLSPRWNRRDEYGADRSLFLRSTPARPPRDLARFCPA